MRRMEKTIIKREEIFRECEGITRRLKAINSLEKRTRKLGLFKSQKDELQNKLNELRKRF